GQLAQNAMNFAAFGVLESHQFVVEIDGFERLQKQSLPRGTRAMNHARQLAALPHQHGDHEPLIANRDVFVLQYTFITVGLEEAFERILNRLLLLLDVAAYAIQVRARTIEHRTIGLNLA